MPGQVPLSNAKFTSSPDFNRQAIAGITGYGVFRTFNYTDTGASSRTLTNVDLWSTLDFVGNSVVTIPAGLSANIGDEILCVNDAGTISFSTTGEASLLTPSLYSVPSSRPARLIYAGSDSWLLAGAKTAYFSNTAANCCGQAVPSVYTFGRDFSVVSDQIAYYANQFGTALYSYPDTIVVAGDAYTINAGIISFSACALVNFDVPYTFYDFNGDELTLYSYVSIDTNDDAAILGVPFKTSDTYSVFPCDTVSAAHGTYYRTFDMYSVDFPVCISDGLVVSFTVCPG